MLCIQQKYNEYTIRDLRKKVEDKNFDISSMLKSIPIPDDELKYVHKANQKMEFKLRNNNSSRLAQRVFSRRNACRAEPCTRF